MDEHSNVDHILDTPSPSYKNSAYVNTVESAPKFGIKDKLGYMFGDLGFNALQVLVNTYLMIFYVNIMGITPVHFSLIIGVSRAADAMNNPFIGMAVDNSAGTKWGKYKPFILKFLVPYLITTVLLFMNFSALPYTAKIVYVLVTYFIWGIVQTFINVPYGAMLNVVTTDMKERTELSNYRSIGSTFANIIVTTVAPLMLFDAYDNPVASRFPILAIGLAIFAGVSLLLTHLLTYERVLIPDRQEGEKINYIQVMKTFGKNRPMLAVILAYVFAKFFIQTTGLTNQYVYMSYYSATNMLATLGLGTMVPVFIAMALVKPLVNKFGKKRLLEISSILAAAFFSVNAFFPVSSVGYIAFQLIGQFFMNFFSLLIWSLIADAVDYHTYLNKERNDGVIYATITFLVFVISSFSTSMVALLLEFAGYDPTLGAQQAQEVATNIKFMGGILPVIGAILIFVCFKFIYNVSDRRMQEISEEVNKM